MREFIIAAEQADTTDEEPGFVFKVRDENEKDGRELRAYKPTEGQYALLMMVMGRHASNTDQFAGIIDFFIQVLDDASQQYVIDRMMSRDRIIPLETITEIMQAMLEEWGGRPTQSPSASTPSRRSGGRKSTAITQS